MTDITVIDELVSKRDAARKEETASKEQRTAQAQESIANDARDEIGKDGLGWLLDYGRELLSVDSKGNGVFEWTLSPKGIRELNICPVQIVAERPFGWRADFRSNEGVPFLSLRFEVLNSNGIFSTIQNKDEWLTRARDEYQHYNSLVEYEAARKLTVEDGYPFNAYYNEDYEKLCQTAPGMMESWDKEYKEYQKEINKIKTDKQKTAEEESAHQKVKDSYRKAWGEYKAAALAVYAHNEKIIQEAQAEFRKTATLYELTYGVVALDADEKYVETRTVWVKTMGTKEGMFTLLDGDIIKYHHPISLRKVEAGTEDGASYVHTFYLAENPNGVPGYNARIQYLFGITTEEMIRESLTARGLKEYPAQPDKPDELQWFEAELIQGEKSEVEDDR